MARRKRAIICLAALILVLLFLHISGAYSPTPARSVEKFLDWYGVEDTAVLGQLEEDYLTRYHLCANGQQVMLLRSEFSISRGWRTELLRSIDGAGAGTVRVHYESGMSFAITFGCASGTGHGQLVLFPTEIPEDGTPIKPEEIFTCGGNTYFIKCTERHGYVDRVLYEKFRCLGVFDAAGQLIETLPITNEWAGF